MKPIPLMVIAAALAGSLSACANAQDSEEAASAGDEPRRCMLVRTIDDYHPIDRNHLVIIDRSEETFLLGTMRPSCWQLQSSHAIALQSAPISICEGQTATLMVSGERCYIRTLEAVESVQAAETLVGERAEAGDQGP